MNYTDRIFSLVWDISDFFYNVMLATREIPFVGMTIAGWFWQIHRAFWNLLTPIANVGDWIDYIQEQVDTLGLPEWLLKKIQEGLSYGIRAWLWVYDAVANVQAIINTWWTTQLQELITWWNTELQELREVKVKWDYFWTVLYPKSVSWDAFFSWWNTELSELQGLINSSIKELEPLWAGWQDWRGKVTEFFTDPEDWLYKAVDRIIERFW